MKAYIAITLLALAVLSTACSPSPEAIATQTASAATAIAVAWTATPTTPPTSTPTITPSPTSTSTATNTPTPTRTFTPTPIPTLPALYVDGAYVKRSDTGKAVWLKGVDDVEFVNDVRTFADLYKYKGLKEIVDEKWGVNLLRVALDTDFLDSSLTEIDKLVAFANQNGMYVILTAFPSHINPARSEDKLPVPDDNVVEAMARLADHYKDNTNVLYGLWNEPHPWVTSLTYEQNWQLWINAGIKVAKAIRAKNPQSILVVPGGFNWARDLRYYKDHPFPFENVIYDVHDYPTPPSTGWASYDRSMWTWIIGKYPLLIGEFAGACCLNTNPPLQNPPLQSDQDIKYKQEVLDIANNNPNLVHYAMWVLINYSDYAIFQLSLEPTRTGKLLLTDLTKYPPTQFR